MESKVHGTHMMTSRSSRAFSPIRACDVTSVTHRQTDGKTNVKVLIVIVIATSFDRQNTCTCMPTV